MEWKPSSADNREFTFEVVLGESKELYKVLVVAAAQFNVRARDALAKFQASREHMGWAEKEAQMAIDKLENVQRSYVGPV